MAKQALDSSGKASFGLLSSVAKHCSDKASFGRIEVAKQALDCSGKASFRLRLAKQALDCSGKASFGLRLARQALDCSGKASFGLRLARQALDCSGKASFGLLWQSKLWTPLISGKASFGLLWQNKLWTPLARRIAKTMNTFNWLLIGHLLGDWLLQSDWMARGKREGLFTQRGRYILPFTPLALCLVFVFLVFRQV